MSDDERIKERLRRTFAQVGASTTITSRSALPDDLGEATSASARRWSLRTRTAVASLGVAAIAAGGFVLITRGSAHRLDVVGGSTTEPSTTTTTDPMAGCPMSGVAPNGKTFGRMPSAGPVRPGVPDYVGYTGGTDRVVGFIRLGPTSQAVYACDLKTRVGNIYPRKGYVPIGIDPATVPDLVSHLVTVNALGIVVSDDVAMVEMVWAEGGSPLAVSLAQAGLVPGDTITSLDGTAVTTGASLNAATAGVQPGDAVQISWTDKAGRQHTATIQT